MALFTIADLHLSEGCEKPMDVFGGRWKDHASKIKSRWESVVGANDTVVVAGDISWAMDLDGALEDFKFIDALPGKKLIGKGNHDFWWSTVSKMKNFLSENGITTVDFLYNNSFETEDFIICGTRGWYVEEKYQNTVGEVDYRKIVDREALRLRMSLNSREALRGNGEKSGDNKNKKETLIFLHFPPVFGSFVCDELISVMKEYKIERCFFGHIHGNYTMPKSFEYEGITMSVISSDFLDFTPKKILPRAI